MYPFALTATDTVCLVLTRRGGWEGGRLKKAKSVPTITTPKNSPGLKMSVSEKLSEPWWRRYERSVSWTIYFGPSKYTAGCPLSDILLPVETLRTDSVWLQYPLPHAEVHPEPMLEQCWNGCWITVMGVLKNCANWGDTIRLQHVMKGYWSCTERIRAKEVQAGVEPRSPQSHTSALTIWAM